MRLLDQPADGLCRECTACTRQRLYRRHVDRHRQGQVHLYGYDPGGLWAQRRLPERARRAFELYGQCDRRRAAQKMQAQAVKAQEIKA